MATEQQDSLQPLQHDQEEIQRRFVEAYEQYRRAVQRAWIPEDVQRRLVEAHRQYVRTVTAAFTEMDVAAVDMHTLAAVSQSMMAAAWLAAACGIESNSAPV